MTGNAFVASAYAAVALAFLRDCRSGRLGPIDPDRPIHVVELAAGHGHFGFLFLRALESLRQALPELAALRLRFVMTDLAPANVAAWAASDRLRPFVEQGLLDFGVLDAEKGDEIVLRRSGERLRPESGRNPSFVVANYLFDSLPQDVFFLRRGELFEGAVSLRSDRPEDLAAPQPGLLARLRLGWEPRPVARPYYAAEPALERVLEGYRARLADGALLFPVGAMRLLGNVERLLGPRLVLLAADKGESDEAAVVSRGTPALTLHGGFFSLGVDFNALGTLVRDAGGEVLHSPGRDGRLRLAGFLIGGAAGAWAESRLAFAESLGRFSPLDYFALTQQLRRANPAPPLEAALAALRLGRGDTRLWSALTPGLLEQLAAAPPHLRRDLLRELDEAWARFFPMADDVPFELGRVAARLGQPLEALRFFAESLRRFGPSAPALFNAGLCLYGLRRAREALRLFEAARALAPGSAPCREWAQRVRSEIAAAGEGRAD